MGHKATLRQTAVKIIIYILLGGLFVFALYYGSQQNVDVTWIVQPKSSTEHYDVKPDTDIRDAVKFVK